MKLHANHRTCPSSRRLICRRRARGGLDARPGGGGGWLQRADCEQVAAQVPRRRQRAVRSFLASQAKPEPALAGACANDRGAQAAVDDRGGDRRDPAAAAARPFRCGSARIGLGKRSRLRPAPSRPDRYERRHPGELVHVDIKKLGRISARGAGQPRARPPWQPVRAAGRGTQDALHRLRVRARDGRRPLAPGLRRGARRPHRRAARSPSCAAPSPGLPSEVSACER